MGFHDNDNATEISVSVHTNKDSRIEGKVIHPHTRYIEIGGCAIFVDSPKTAQRIADATMALYKED
jgi:hypothetical protein